MAIQDNRSEEIKGPKGYPEKIIPAGEQQVHFDQEGKEKTERREVSQDDKKVSDALKREIEMMQLDDAAKDEAKKKAEKIGSGSEKEKIEHLLEIAREKGLVFAIHVARETNDPFILDVLHDTLAKEGFYKKIMTKSDDDDDDKKV